MRVKVGTRYVVVSKPSGTAFLIVTIRDEKDRLRWETLRKLKNISFRRVKN